MFSPHACTIEKLHSKLCGFLQHLATVRLCVCKYLGTHLPSFTLLLPLSMLGISTFFANHQFLNISIDNSSPAGKEEEVSRLARDERPSKIGSVCCCLQYVSNRGKKCRRHKVNFHEGSLTSFAHRELRAEATTLRLSKGESRIQHCPATHHMVVASRPLSSSFLLYAKAPHAMRLAHPLFCRPSVLQDLLQRHWSSN